MRPILSCLLLALAAAIFTTGCSSTAPAAPPSVARVYAEPPAHRWESYAPYVKIVAIDGEETTRTQYVDLKPGFHHLMVTARRDAAANGMSWGLGVVGSMIGSAIDSASSAGHLTTLDLEASAGETYITRLHDDDVRYTFWIETYPEGRVVSGFKPPGVGRTRNPR